MERGGGLDHWTISAFINVEPSLEYSNTLDVKGCGAENYREARKIVGYNNNWSMGQRGKAHQTPSGNWYHKATTERYIAKI